MPPPIDLAMLVLSPLAGACLAYWSAACWRVVDSLRRVPTARSGAALPAPRGPDGAPPRVCAIIPAHNERQHIAALVESLRSQDYPRLSVVLALDRCTDGTEEEARRAIDEPRGAAGSAGPTFEVFRVGPCPEGWAGKVHAVWSAVRHSEAARDADLLLFADADTVFDPACVRAAAALLEDRSLAMLSLLSTLTCDRWFERVAQASAGLELMRMYPLTSANRWPDPRPFANGQFMLFRRSAYERVGGHGAVHAELLEDIALARRVAAEGLRPGLLVADGMLVCRMYETWAGFRRGWKRIFTEAGNRRSIRLRSNAWRQAVTGFALPVAACACLAAAWAGAPGLFTSPRLVDVVAAGLGAGGVSAWAVSMGLVLRTGRVPLWTIVLQPLGALLCAYVQAEAARDLRRGKATAWAGRSYVLADRGRDPRSRSERAVARKREAAYRRPVRRP